VFFLCSCPAVVSGSFALCSSLLCVHVRVQAMLMFDHVHSGMPVMVICATRVIQKGEEIITDYGEFFWTKISSALVREHQSFHQKAGPQIDALEARLRELVRDEQAQARQVEPQSIALDSVVLPLPPSSKWDCYRILFNQHDVLYEGVRPVRVSPERHADPFAHQMYTRSMEAARLAREREAERVARAAKMQAAAVAKAKATKAAERATTSSGRRIGRAPEPSDANSAPRRASARVQLLAAADEEAIAAAEELKAEEEGESEEESTAAAAAAPTASSSRVAKSNGRAKPAVARSNKKKKGRSGGSKKAAKKAASSYFDDDDDDSSDVVLLSAPPSPRAPLPQLIPASAPPSASSAARLPPRTLEHQFLSASSSTPSHQCDECGAACNPRDYRDWTFMKCRACFKRRVAQLLRAEAEGDAQRAQAKRRDAQAALETAASAARSVSVESLAESTPDAAAAAVAASPPPLIAATATAAAASNSPSAFAAAVGASPAKRHRDHSGSDGQSSAAVGEQKDGRRSRSPSRAPKRLATKSAMNNDQSHHQSHFSFN